MLKVDAKVCTLATLGLFVGISSGQAQSQNVDYLSYEGVGIIMGDTGTITANSPGTISATCTSLGYSVGDTRLVVLRYSLGPSTPTPTASALSFLTQRGAYRIATTTVGASLSTAPGTAAVDWQGISGRAGHPTQSGSSSTLTINSGTGGALNTSFQWNNHARIIGSINDFEANPGCNVNFRASLVFRQN
jgi:hypothetical protein